MRGNYVTIVSLIVPKKSNGRMVFYEVKSADYEDC
jgi:hypothetical protein